MKTPFVSIRPSTSMVFLLISLSLFSCVTTPLSTSPANPPRLPPAQSIRVAQNEGLFSLFVASSETTGAPVSLSFLSVEVHDDTGWHVLSGANRRLLLNEANRMQELLLITPLASSTYDTLRLTVDGLRFLDANGLEQVVFLTPRTFELSLPQNFQIENTNHKTIFLQFNARQVRPGDASSLTFHALGEDLSLNRDLLFVCCPEINTIWALRTDTNRVSRSYRISGVPTYIEVTPDGQNLVILIKDKAELQVVEISSGRTLDIIRLTSMREPLYMTIDSNGTSAYVIGDYNQVLRCDLITGVVAARKRVGQDLQYCLYLDKDRQLAVSSSQTQKIIFLEGVSLQEMSSVETGRHPAGLASSGQTLYVAEQGTRNIGSLDLSTGEYKRRPLGLAPQRIQLAGDFLFAGAAESPMLTSVHLPFLGNAKNIAIEGKPGEMVFAEGRKWLYVGSNTHSSITVVDINTRNSLFTISHGSPSLGLATMR